MNYGHRESGSRARERERWNEGKSRKREGTRQRGKAGWNVRCSGRTIERETLRVQETKKLTRPVECHSAFRITFYLYPRRKYSSSSLFFSCVIYIIHLYFLCKCSLADCVQRSIEGKKCSPRATVTRIYILHWKGHADRRRKVRKSD